MARVNLKKNYVNGSILYGDSLNLTNTMIETGVNDNADRIVALEEGTTLSGNASKLSGATLSEFADETLQDSDIKVPTSKQVKTYIDNSDTLLDARVDTLENAGYLTTETDPTVPSWAKQPTKPTYTAAEVGALPTSTQLKDLIQDATHRTVTDVEKSTWNAKQNALVEDVDYLTPETANLLYEGVKGADDNYVTDAEKVKLSNLSGVNTGDQDLSGLEPKRGADDNYVTDAEKAALHSHSNKSSLDLVSGVNTGDQDLSGYATVLDLDNKQDTLVSGTNIKTINGNNILGSGDIVIEGGSSSYTLPAATDTILGGVKVGSRLSISSGVLSADVQTTDISGKQDTLISGTNIKTINSTSILGSGNIVIEGGSSTAAEVSYDNTDSDIVATNVQDAIDEVVEGVGGLATTLGGEIATLNSAVGTLGGELIGKQDTLISGTNIKTINSTSILGSGDLTISGGSSVTEVSVSTAATTVAKVGTTTTGTYVPTLGDILRVTFSLGSNINNPTLNIDGSGDKNIRLGNTNVSTAIMGTTSSLIVNMWYDGTYYQLFGSLKNDNTTYTEISEAEITAGTASTVRGISGRRSEFIVTKARTGKEDTSNKVTSLSSSSTDIEYPSAKLVYDQLAGKQAVGNYSTDIHSNITALNAVSGINTGDQDLSGKLDKTNGTTTVNVDANAFKVATASGVVTIGSQNTEYTHFNTDRPQYYMNKGLSVTGTLYKGPSYNVNVPGVFISASAPTAVQAGDIWVTP